MNEQQGQHVTHIRNWFCSLSVMTLILSFPSYASNTGLAPMTPVLQKHGFGIQLQAGSAIQDWSVEPTTPTPKGTPKQSYSRFNMGTSVSYQFNNQLAIKTGYLYFHNVTLKNQPYGTVHSWLVYAAGQLSRSLFGMPNLTSALEFGLAYNNNHIRAGISNNYWVPWFATMVRYNLTDRLNVHIKGNYLLGYHSTKKPGHAFIVPNAYIINVGIGYAFVS